jgi:hypothetical protein
LAVALGDGVVAAVVAVPEMPAASAGTIATVAMPATATTANAAAVSATLLMGKTFPDIGDAPLWIRVVLWWAVSSFSAADGSRSLSHA